MKTKPFKIEDCDKNKKIIIYGASVYGELAYRGLKAAGISPTFFCDQSNQRDIYLGIKVISPQQLGDYVNDNIIIASADFFFERGNTMKKWMTILASTCLICAIC